ncbi:MAG TPA: hypothetical protein PLE09_05470 [Caldisericia bacterium]|nr:hypothetical protein [Caldisericia bacterium]
MRIHTFYLITFLFLFVVVSSMSGCKDNNQQLEQHTEYSENISCVYHCLGPYGGRIDCIAASSHDARFILASSSNHAFITKDGGTQWEHILLPTSRITSMSFHPTMKSNCYILDQDKLYASLNFGDEWNVLPFSQNMVSPYYQLVVHPSGSIFVSCAAGLFVQENMHDQWKQIYTCLEGEAPLEKITISNTDENFIFAISAGKNVYYTKDKGIQWNKIDSSTFKNRLLSDIVIHPSFSSFIALLYPGGVICSLNEGETWEYETKTRLPSPAYNVAITKTGILYAGTQKGVWQSLDQGYSWETIPPLQESVYSLVSGFSDQYLFAGTNQNIYRYFLTDQKWNPLSEGISAQTIVDFAIQPVEVEEMILVDKDQKAYHFFRPYEEWKELNNTPPLDVFFGSSQDFSSWYGIRDNVLMKMDKNTLLWETISTIPSHSQVYKVWIHPQDPSIWFAGTRGKELSSGDGLWMSVDHGVQWQQLEQIGNENTIRNVCFDPVEKSVIYCHGETLFGEKKLFKSEDQGYSWKTIHGQWEIESIEVDLARSGIVWGMTANGEFLVSSDFGETWFSKIDFSKEFDEKMFSYPAGYDIVSMHEDGSCIVHLYRGLYLYVLHDGEAWIPIHGIPDTSFYKMQLHPKKTNTLYIATDLGLIECILDL